MQWERDRWNTEIGVVAAADTNGQKKEDRFCSASDRSGRLPAKLCGPELREACVVRGTRVAMSADDRYRPNSYLTPRREAWAACATCAPESDDAASSCVLH
jgi:hypothetical protein